MTFKKHLSLFKKLPIDEFMPFFEKEDIVLNRGHFSCICFIGVQK